MLGYPPQTFKTSFYPPQNKKLGRPWTVGNVYLLGCLRRRGGGGLFVLGEGNLPQKNLHCKGEPYRFSGYILLL